MKRLALACALLALLAFVLRAVGVGPGNTYALATDFTLVSIDCSRIPGHISIQNTSGSSATFDQLSITITQTNGTSTTERVIDTVTSPGTPGGNYGMVGGGVLDEQVGPGATQSPPPPTAPPWPTTPATILPSGQSLVFSAAQLLNPGATVTLFDASTSTQLGTQTCQASSFSRTLTVSTTGFDFIAPNTPNSVCGPDLPAGTSPTPTNPGPCFTIANALTWARDGDTIVVEAGIYEVCAPIEVNKLVHITSQGAKTILHSYAGQTVFHVTAVGGGNAGVPGTTAVGPASISEHASIDGFEIGGVTQSGAAAIFLDNDAYTDVINNVLGGETLNNPAYTGAPCNPPSAGQPFPHGPTPTASVRTETFANSASIILSSSDHPNISNNTIQGSSRFAFTPTLTPNPTDSGFGIVSIECLGLGSDISDSVKIAANLVDNNTNAGIWLCSDGGGSHTIQNNIFKNNGRGIVLRAIADSLIDSNTVTDDFQDGIVVYDASESDTISNNLIESNRTPGAAGIRIGDFGAGLYPLFTTVAANRLTRNWIGVDIAGARSTTLSSNVISSEDLRTGVLIEPGSAGAAQFSQPSGTSLQQNQIISNGACNATSGCAIRLGAGETQDVDASLGNKFGLPVNADVDTVLWHKPNDPSLGYINAGQVTPPLTQTSPPAGVPASGPVAVPTSTPGSGGATTTPGGTSPSSAPGASSTIPIGAPGAGGGGPSSSVSTTAAPGTAAPARVNAGPAQPLSSTFSSPTLTAGPPRGTTTYSPVCNFVSVSAGLVSTVSVAGFLSQFQPASNIVSAWRVNNGTHLFDALYFAGTNAPVEAITLHGGDIVAICVSGAVQGPP